MALTPRTEDALTGTNFSGSDGDSNRTYVVANTPAISDFFSVSVAGATLQQSVHFTFNESTYTLTIINPLFNDQDVTLNYFSGSGALVGVNYCADTDVQLVLGSATAFSASTNPTATQVNSMILQAEDHIDRLTNHAWKEKTITNEFYNLDVNAAYNVGAGIRIKLRHRKIKTLDSNEGDKVEIWDGSAYEDYLVTRTQGRASDFWIDPEQGVLWLKLRHFSSVKNIIRMSYRYGESTVPYDIQEATAQYVAMKILLNEDKGFYLNENGDNRNMVYSSRYDRLKSTFEKTIHNRTELNIFGP